MEEMKQEDNYSIYVHICPKGEVYFDLQFVKFI